jgi:hypothetical protein
VTQSEGYVYEGRAYHHNDHLCLLALIETFYQLKAEQTKMKVRFIMKHNSLFDQIAKLAWINFFLLVWVIMLRLAPTNWGTIIALVVFLAIALRFSVEIKETPDTKIPATHNPLLSKRQDDQKDKHL